MANVLGNLVIQLQANTSAFANGMADARTLSLTTSEGIVASLKTVESQLARLKFGSAGEIKKSAEIAGAAIAGIGVAAAVAAVTFAKSTADQARTLHNLSTSYGISVEALSGLTVASKITGVSMESLAKGMGFLDRAAVGAVGGNKQLAIAFQQIGINAKDLTDGKGGMKEQLPLLLLVADHFSQLKDGVLKAAEGKKIFGRSFQDVLPIINQGAAAIQGYIDKAKALGFVLTAEDIAAALKFRESLDLVDLKVDALKLQIGIGMMQSLNGLSNAFLTADSSGNTLARSLSDVLGKSLVSLVEAFGWINTKMSEGIVLGGMYAKVVSFGIGGIGFTAGKEMIAKMEQQQADLVRNLHPPAVATGAPTPKFSPPVIPTGAGTNKAAEEQFRQMESLLKSMRADWGLTLAEEASFWDQMLVPAKKYADNLRKVTDQINDVLGRMREETRKLTEKLFGLPEDQAAYAGATYNAPNLAKLGLPTTGLVQPPMASFGEAGKMFDEAQQKRENELETENNRIVEEIIRKQKERVSVYDALRMPMEQLAEYQERLNVDYHNGTIDGETWARAMAEASDNIKGMYDPTVKLEKEIKALNEAYAAGLVGLSNYTKQLKQLQAEQSMAKLTTAPQPGMAGVGQGINAGLQTVATQWQGIPAETGQAMVKVAGDMQNAFATAFQSMIMGTKTVGQAFAQMGVSLLSELVGTLMQMLAQWMIHFAAVHLLHLTSATVDAAIDTTALATTAATRIATNVMTATSDAAVAAANTLAECPWPLNMAMAPVVFAQGLAYAGMAAAERGALLDRDMPIFAHANEMVLPANISQHVMATAGGGGQRGGPGPGLGGNHFSPTFHIYGATDAQAVSDQVMNRVHKFFRTGGVIR